MNAPRLLRMLYHQIGSHRIDVGAVVDMNYRQRLFRITDRQQPYKINIKLYEPHEIAIYHPTNAIELYTNKTCIMPSDDECRRHIDEIKEKQQMIEEFERKMRSNFLS